MCATIPKNVNLILVLLWCILSCLSDDETPVGNSDDNFFLVTINLTGAFIANTNEIVWQWETDSENDLRFRYQIITDAAEGTVTEWTEITEKTLSIENVEEGSTYAMVLSASEDGETWSDSASNEVIAQVALLDNAVADGLTANSRPIWHLAALADASLCEVKFDSLFDDWQAIDCAETFRGSSPLTADAHTLFFRFQNSGEAMSEVHKAEMDIEEIAQVRIQTTEDIATALTQNPPDENTYTVSMEINDTLFENAEIALHGQSSLNYSRHSFEISLAGAEEVLPGLESSDFLLIAMEADYGYFNHFFAYTLLSDLGIFLPYFKLMELEINDVSQGMVLFIERSEDAIVRQNPTASIVLRRGYDLSYDVDYYESIDNLDLSQEEYESAYQQLVTAQDSLSGEELFDTLTSSLNLEQYFNWLGLNTWIMNGDYTDEIYFYGKAIYSEGGAAPYFNISVWDYDDLFLDPHNGSSIEGSLVYAGENVLDIAIAGDSYLYQQFLENFDELLTDKITEEAINQVVATHSAQIQKFFSRPEIYTVQKNATDGSENSLSQLQALYEARRVFLIERRAALLAEIEDAL